MASDPIAVPRFAQELHKVQTLLRNFAYHAQFLNKLVHSEHTI
jgi:hypothetical protein